MAEETDKKPIENNEEAEEVKDNETQNEEAAASESNEVTENEKSSEEPAQPVKIKNTLEAVEADILKEQNNDGKFPEFNVGDTIRVYVKIKEGNKERLQPYEGVVMGFKHGGPRKSFIVRRISYEVSVERVFPFHSPYIEKIELIRHGRVKRAKLYYLRGRFGKAAKIREKVSNKVK